MEIHVQRTSDVETEWLLEAVCGNDDDDDDKEEEEEEERLLFTILPNECDLDLASE